MSFVLMLVGILATALGAILIGFGIPINEFSLGNTLILAGTVTAAGGVIIFALSRVVAQLSRIAEHLAARPLAAAMAAGADPFDPSRSPAVPRPRADMPPSAPRAPEPRLQAPDFDMPAARTAAMEEHEEVSLSPRAPARAAPEPATTPSGWRPPRPSEPAQPRPEPRRPAAPQAGTENPFEATWPGGRKPAAAPRREPVVEPAQEAPAEAPRPEPVSVLKSGVVDGMAYTLYTDGSIEAELAQGVVRFGSIEELRNHLEKSA
jgi:hypothetical protein